MTESSKTITFVSVAALMVGLAGLTHIMNRPKPDSDFELVGKPFFEDFTSSEQAKSLEVSAVDPETLTLQKFSVKNEKGLWRIPSHHNYPAEAASRLAQTATSVMGIERETLAGRLPSEHEKLGVIDPLNDNNLDIEDPEAAGKRITLRNGEGDVLVDYIVGKEAGEVEQSEAEQSMMEGAQPEKYYYVRRADEQQTYKVRMDIDLSTRFSDWIDPDLLRLERDKLVRLEIDNYTLSEDRSNPLSQVHALIKVQGDQLDLSRASSTDPWQLEDLDPAKEELKTARINEIISVLDEMKIAGVRPKFKFRNHLLLTPDLKLNRQPEFDDDPQEFARAISRLQDELEDKGFSLAGSAEKLELVSQNGQLEIGTNDGLVYALQVGKEVEGEEKAIEIGEINGGKPASTSTSNPHDENSDNDGENEDVENVKSHSQDDEAAEEKANGKNRYLMIRVAFNDSLLGEKPTKPIEPSKPVAPEGYQPPTNEDDLSNEKNSDGEVPADVDAPEVDDVDAETEQDSESEQGDEENESDESTERDPEFAKYDEELAAYEQTKIEYELALSRFQEDVKSHQKKIAEGKKLVDEMNQRFSDWYYVITAENLKTLQTERSELVTVKEAPPTEENGDGQEEDLPAKPDISFPESPELEDE